MTETCYMVAERFSSAAFPHGPIAMVEQSFPVFPFAPAGVTWPSIRETIDRVHSLGAKTSTIADQSNKKGTRAIVPPASPHRKSAAPKELYTPLP
ncbi:MAG: hypothetical protein ACKV2U_14905 [Bryobacteraceae bacterium]